MARHSIVGQAGDIPYDFYLRKQEKTELFEDPTMINYYQRTLLSDFRPDKPFMASEEGRQRYDSAAKLNLQYTGTRGGTDPYLPDGLNTNFDYYIENSPAGPDMQKYAKQQRERGKFINFYPDESNDTMEAGIAPAKMNRNIRQAQNWVKDRLKIFSTSLGTLQRNTNISYPVKSKIELATKDGMVMAPLDDINKIVRPDRTSLLSNGVNLGYRTNVDHRFKVSKYGQVRTADKPSDWFKNWYETEMDSEVPISWEGINISPDLAKFMADLSRLKREKHRTDLQSQFGTIKELANRNFKLQPKDIAGFMGRPYAGSATTAPHTTYDGKQIHISGNRFIPQRDDNKFSKISIDKNVVELMEKAVKNKKMAPREVDDLRKQLVQSAAQSGIYTMDLHNMVRTINHKKNIRDNLDSAIDDHYKEESGEIFNYKLALPTDFRNAKNQPTEKYKTASNETQVRTHGSQIISQIEKGTYMNDGEYGLLEGKTQDRHARGLGSKYMHRMHQVEELDNGVNDL